MILRAFLFALPIFLVACIQPRAVDVPNGDEHMLGHVKNLRVEEYENFQILYLKNQKLDNDWKKLVTYKTGLPDSIRCSDDYVKLKVPVGSIVSNSTTHLGMIESLRAIDVLKGFAQTQFISSEKINENVRKGDIVEIGNNTQLNIEEILYLRPQIVLTSGLMENSHQISQLKSSGIEMIGLPDFAENSLLGKAEWIKFFGFLTDKNDLAVKIFDAKQVIYDSLTHLIVVEDQPTVLSGTLYGGNWFLPGGSNYNADVIAQAGGEYLWRENGEDGWLNLDFEVVYERAWNANVWIGAANFNSLSEMKEVDERYANFEAFRRGEVYTYTARVNENGANDYFESGNINPEKVLADHIKILHPEILPNYSLYYYVKLEE